MVKALISQNMFLVVLFFVLILLMGLLALPMIFPNHNPTAQRTMISLTIQNAKVNAEVANTEEARRQGLSGREALHENEGMLFVFEEERVHGMWMKEMNFPLDIVWMDGQKRVVHVAANVAPDTFPTIFRPKDSALYVLELPAGFVTKHVISIGDSATFVLE